MSDDPLTLHDDCGGTVSKVYGPVRNNKVASTSTDIESRWAKDMPAYKRFRDAGHQPPQIDGCDKLEATAKNDLAIRSGGRINLDENIMREKKAMAEDIMAGRI
jgi:hypothetical protein